MCVCVCRGCHISAATRSHGEGHRGAMLNYMTVVWVNGAYFNFKNIYIYNSNCINNHLPLSPPQTKCFYIIVCCRPLKHSTGAVHLKPHTVVVQMDNRHCYQQKKQIKLHVSNSQQYSPRPTLT